MSISFFDDIIDEWTSRAPCVQYICSEGTYPACPASIIRQVIPEIDESSVLIIKV